VTPRIWEDALLAATLLAIDPAGLQGAVIRARYGSVRDRWQAYCRAALPADAPMRRLPIGTSDGRLLGGLDLAATLQAGRPIAERGLLAEVDGGLLILAMAERMTPSMAARLTAVLDNGEVALERDGLTGRTPSRFGLIAYDEGDGPDEAAPAALAERLAFLIDLDPVRDQEAATAAAEIDLIHDARRRLPGVGCDPEILTALCGTAMALGVASIRAPILTLRAARAIAALAGRDQIEEADATLACRLVLAPRATRMPPQEADQETAPPEPESNDSQNAGPPPEQENAEQVEPSVDQALDDRVLEATKAAIPARLLSEMGLLGDGSRRKGSAGKAGAALKSTLRGRPIGARPGDPGGGVRLNVIETLRAAAPWQGLRRATSAKPKSSRIFVRREDFRVTRFKARTETTAIFLVDASGSSALNRLAEVKGAVELLLADCYVRRDSVAVMAFRGRGAELLLPPTRSLVRAKRSLAALPGGGGTPLASGIDAAFALADTVKRRGQTPVVIILTDGQANVSREGIGGRGKAGEDALNAARQARLAAITCLLIDSAPRPQAQARSLAAEMGARYLALPYANASLLSAAVRSTGIG
jgi:magnesium chelatase subunit D